MPLWKLILDENKAMKTTSCFSSAAVRVLELAAEEAQQSDSATIDLRHLFIALLVEETGKAGQVLKEFGVTPLDARNGLLGPAH